MILIGRSDGATNKRGTMSEAEGAQKQKAQLLRELFRKRVITIS